MIKNLKHNKKRAIVIYIIILLTLYIIVEVLPKVTDIFETTEVLEVGNLALECETTGYFIKDEYICISPLSGDITYKDEEGTVVKKGHVLCEIDQESGNDNSNNRFDSYVDRLSGSSKLTDSFKAPISGVYSLAIDGNENVFTKENMKAISREEAEGCNFKVANLDRKSVRRGEPVYKVSGDDEWFVLCWMDKNNAVNYPEGEKVTLKLPDGQVAAKVSYVKEEVDCVRIIFELDVYYKSFTDTRMTEMTVVARADEGLIVSNDCIIDKGGKEGVYVVNKNGKNIFTPVKIISTDGKNSVLKDTTYQDEEGNQVNTVDVYDTVLKHPDNALKKELKEAE